MVGFEKKTDLSIVKDATKRPIIVPRKVGKGAVSIHREQPGNYSPFNGGEKVTEIPCGMSALLKISPIAEQRVVLFSCSNCL